MRLHNSLPHRPIAHLERWFPAALLAVLRARVVNQNLAHQARGDAEEVRAALPRHILTHESHVSLVNQRGGLQRVAGAK